MSHEKGKVYLLGGGPGDIELLTLKGRTILEKADILLYDNLIGKGLLKYCRADCEKIYVGKKDGKHALPQEEINRLLVEKAEKNKIIVRLKGGDPFVFGRGSEETLTLINNKIDFEIIPGISAGIAVPSYAGIPLTHRNVAVSAAFITGHEAQGKSESGINWEHLSTGVDTLVFFMGVKNLEHIVENLIKNGRAEDTPVAIIQNGTTSRQKVTIGTLGNIVSLAEKENVVPPAIILVGEVVKFRENLNWFESKPLFGKRIVVTRSRTQASKMVQMLDSYAADTVELPVIQFQYPEDRSFLQDAFEKVQDYNWLIFTSANGVEYFMNYFIEEKHDIRKLGSCRIASMGPATSDKIISYFLSVDFQPQEFVAETFIDEFLRDHDVKDKNILLVHSDKARSYIQDQLKDKGAHVNALTGYLTLPPSDNEFKCLSEQDDIDMVTFTSSSTVINFFKNYKGNKNFKIASIGPITSKAVKKLGHEVDIEAKEYTIPGLVTAILDYYK